MISYPNRARAQRAVRRRHDAYLRTLYLNVPRRAVLAMSEEIGYDLTNVEGMTAARLRPVLDHISRRSRHHQAMWGPVFERVFLDTVITSLDTLTISTA